MNSPGAIVFTPFAALPTPPSLTMGVSGSAAATEPVRSRVAESNGEVSVWACTVTFTSAATFFGTQVADHSPKPTEVSGSGGSPFENVATTEPLSTWFAQLSITKARIGVGWPAVALDGHPRQTD